MNDTRNIEKQQNQSITLYGPRKIDQGSESTEIQQVVDLLTRVNEHLTNTRGLDHYTWYTDNEGQRVREKIKKGNTYVILSDAGKVIATFTIGREVLTYDNAVFFDEEGNVIEGKTQFDDSPAYYLSMMCVSPDLQGNGIGKKVMKMMERIIEIDVKATNGSTYLIRFDARQEYSDLMRFYQNQGYKEVGLVKEGEGENYVLFERESHLSEVKGPYSTYHVPGTVQEG